MDKGPVARETNLVLRRYELSALAPPTLPPPPEKGDRLEAESITNQSPMVNNLINHAYVMKPP